VHKTALERVQQQGNLAKQRAEDATNQAQEALREATASKLLAQVPPSRFVSACKLLYSKRMCGRYRLKFSLALPLCFALSSSSCACVRAFFQAHTIALERVEQQGNLAKQKAEDATEQAQEALREATASKLLAQVPPSLDGPVASCCIANDCVDVVDSKSVSLPRSVPQSPLLLARVCAR